MNLGAIDVGTGGRKASMGHANSDHASCTWLTGGVSIHGIAHRGRKQIRYHHHATYLYMSDLGVLKHEDEQTTKPPPSNSQHSSTAACSTVAFWIRSRPPSTSTGT
jgi:hypothetical protein